MNTIERHNPRSERVFAAKLDPQSKTAPGVSCANKRRVPQGLATATEERVTMASVPASEPIYTKPISDEMAAILAPRIMRNIRVTATGCWVRTVNVNAYTGYANIAIKKDGKADYYFAHRVMYVFRRGQIPDGMTIDHLCRVRACCNPAHLEVVTLRENVQRRNRAPLAVPESPSFRRPKPRKPCVGHAFIPDASGKRCSTCARVSAAALKRARAAAAEERPE